MTRHHHRTVIRREHPGSARRRLQWVLSVAIVALGLSFLAGRYTLDAITVPLDTKADRQAADIMRLQVREDIDRQTLAALRDEMANNRMEIAELERELAFYREVMAPEEVTRGMVIRQPVFTPQASPGHWRYQLVAQQGGRGKSARRGNLAVIFWGESDGVVEQYRLRDLDIELQGVKPVLNFRYFQRLEGEFSLPLNFLPTHIVLTATLSKPVIEQIDLSYDWGTVATPVATAQPIDNGVSLTPPDNQSGANESPVINDGMQTAEAEAGRY